MKLIKITAPWCMSCIIMNEKLSQLDLNKYEVISYDADNDVDKFIKYNIGDKLPIFIITDDNDNEIKRLIGEHSKEELLTFIGVSNED